MIRSVIRSPIGRAIRRATDYAGVALVLGAWILAAGTWNDSGTWNDADTWNDGA